ncbi:hypothetical protein [Rickettsia endosymbiont of Gonocerus acuteangulatus]
MICQTLGTISFGIIFRD